MFRIQGEVQAEPLPPPPGGLNVAMIYIFSGVVPVSDPTVRIFAHVLWLTMFGSVVAWYDRGTRT